MCVYIYIYIYIYIYDVRHIGAPIAPARLPQTICGGKRVSPGPAPCGRGLARLAFRREPESTVFVRLLLGCVLAVFFLNVWLHLSLSLSLPFTLSPSPSFTCLPLSPSPSLSSPSLSLSLPCCLATSFPCPLDRLFVVIGFPFIRLPPISLFPQPLSPRPRYNSTSASEPRGAAYICCAGRFGVVVVHTSMTPLVAT